VAVGESMTVDVDARALAADNNLRVVLVPASTSDSVSDPQAFFVDAKDVSAAQQQLRLPAHAAGPSEVRLYSVPHTGTDYRVAARASVMVSGGAN
jgi:hypothetical protein